MGKLNYVIIDCANGESIARFWAQALDGYTVDPEWNTLLKSESAPTLYFQQVPEAKAVKNRLHLNIGAPDASAEVQRLVTLGAKVVEEMNEQGHTWTNMLDPEGNEFCVSGA